MQCQGYSVLAFSNYNVAYPSMACFLTIKLSSLLAAPCVAAAALLHRQLLQGWLGPDCHFLDWPHPQKTSMARALSGPFHWWLSNRFLYHRDLFLNAHMRSGDARGDDSGRWY